MNNYNDRGYTGRNNGSLNLESDPRLRNMNPVKLKIIQEIARGTKGKNLEEVLPDVMKINNELRLKNLSFSKEESNLLMDILMEQMPPQDRKKIAIIKSML